MDKRLPVPPCCIYGKLFSCALLFFISETKDNLPVPQLSDVFRSATVALHSPAVCIFLEKPPAYRAMRLPCGEKADSMRA